MGAASLLLSFVGNRDPYVEHSEDFGPVLSLLRARPFDRVILFCTGSDYLERAKMVEDVCRGFGCPASEALRLPIFVVSTASSQER